jgi:hypothetical protein
MAKTLVLFTVVAALLLPAQPAAALEINDDLLALVAMPLAVAAVSEITDVPANDLIDMVTLLNDADVPPVQFVETVRYVPVALVTADDTQPRFVEVVRQQEQAGVRGIQLVTFIEERLRLYGLPATVDLDVTAPRIIEIDDNDIVPALVRTRVAQVKAHPDRHPHGGPPGQLKKVAGVQTGAEIVHRSGHDDDVDRRGRVTKKQKEKEHKVARGNGGGKGKDKGNKGNKGKGKG